MDTHTPMHTHHTPHTPHTHHAHTHHTHTHMHTHSHIITQRETHGEMHKQTHTHRHLYHQAFHSLYRVLWCQKRLKTKTKLRLFKAIILSTLLYGSETWVPSAKHTKRLQAFIMGCLRVVHGVTKWDKMRKYNYDLWVA